MAEGPDTSASEFASEGNKQIRLPKKTINAEYFMGIQFVVRDFDRVLANLLRVDDPRPPILARQIINRVLDDDIKYALLDKLDSKMKEIDSRKSEYSSSLEMWADKIRVSQDLVGEVNSYMDEFLALHKGQEIGDV